MVTITTLGLFLTLTSCILASPLQRASPFLLSTAINNSTSLSVVNVTSPDVGPENCFEPNPNYLPTNYRDCESAMLQLNPHGTVSELIFSRMSLANGYKLPRFFRSGTCVLYLDMVYDDDFDTMTLGDVATIASQLALQCTVTVSSNALGGVARVGPKQLMCVELMGTRERTVSRANGA